MLFEFPLDALSFLAPLIYFIGWGMLVFQGPIRVLEKEDNISGGITMAAFMVWVGAAACAKNVWENTGFPFYETMANVAMISVLIGIVLYCIGVIRDRARSRAEGHKPRPVIPSISKTMWGLPFWLSGFRNATQPPVVVQTQQVPPPQQQPVPPSPPPPPDPTQPS